MGHDEDNGFSEWGGYFEAKKSKLEEQFAAASDPFRESDLFDGISIFVNGLTNPTADELKRIMMVHGGTYHHYKRNHTNFVIASNLPDVKVRNMDTSHIITAQWVVDCVEQMRILDYTKYLLFTNQKTTQPRLNFAKTKKNETVVSENTDSIEEKEESNLDGLLREMQQAVATSPKKNTSHITNLSATTTTNSSRTARTAVDPEFLSEFYKNSRLHHIATLGAGFKQYVCELRQEHGNKPFVDRIALRTLWADKQEDISMSVSKRYVMHIDMDCFFVSVGLRARPELRGLPIAVTHSKGGTAATDVPVHPQSNRQVERELFAQRFEHVMHDIVRTDKVRMGFEKKSSLSEIASCSYEARAKGIKNGMFVGHALKLCPELKTIPYDFEGYREVAFSLYNTVAQYTLNIEAVSCDEMFVDLTDLLQDLQVDVMTFVTHLRQKVQNITDCPCSAGVGENKLLARMATKLAKPNGQHLLETDDAASYMATTALDVLPGVGSSMTYKLNQAGLNTCGDVQQVSMVRLEMLLGKKSAQTLYQNCRGIDPRPLNYEQQRKSVSAEVNYGIRFTNYEELDKFLNQLSVEVHSRLVEIKRKAKSITLKLMVRAAEAPVETSKFMGHGVCDNQTKSTLLKQSTDSLDTIKFHVLKLMKQSGYPPQELRGIGIHLSKLDEVNEVKEENVIKSMFLKISEKQKDKPINTPATIKEQPLEIKPKLESFNVLDLLKNAATKKKALNCTVTSETETSKQDIEFDMPKTVKYPTPISPDSNPMNAISRVSKNAMPAAVSEFDADVLAQLPEEIRREVLESADAYLRLAKVDEDENSNRKKKKPNRAVLSPDSPPPPAPSMKRRIAKASSPSPPRVKRRIAMARSPSPIKRRTGRDLSPSPIKRRTGRTLSPLNESDLRPSTSKAAKQRILRPDNIVTEYAQELPKHMHPAILQYVTANNNGKNVALAIKQQKQPLNVFLNNNFKSMMASWVKSENQPKPTDVELMYSNICDLVDDNQMDKVYEIMKHFCCLVKAKRMDSCFWHLAYNVIEWKVQTKVQEIFNYNIYFTEEINCLICADTCKENFN